MRGDGAPFLEGIEVTQQFVDGLVAVVAVEGHCLQADGLQFLGDVARRRKTAWLVVCGQHDRFQNVFLGGLVVERVIEGKQFVEDDAEGIDVGTDIQAGVFAVGLFGGHVSRGSGEFPVDGRIAGREDGWGIDFDEGFGFEAFLGGGGRIASIFRCGDFADESPVDDGDFTVVSDADVFGFEVAVQDSLAVGVCDALADFDEDAETSSGGIFPGVGGVLEGELGDDVPQGIALELLHGEVDATGWADADAVDGDDVGVFQLGGGLGLANHALDLIFTHAEFGTQIFDRDGTSQPFVQGGGDQPGGTVSRGREVFDGRFCDLQRHFQTQHFCVQKLFHFGGGRSIRGMFRVFHVVWSEAGCSDESVEVLRGDDSVGGGGGFLSEVDVIGDEPEDVARLFIVEHAVDDVEVGVVFFLNFSRKDDIQFGIERLDGSA